jgi:hypothetical protein
MNPDLTSPPPVPDGTNGVPSDLHDILPAVEIISIWTWLLWSGLLLVALVMGYYFSRFALARWRSRKAESVSSANKVPDHVLARKQLDAALEHMHDARLFCILVSNAIRHYLESRFKMRAPEQTTEEFLEALKCSTSLQSGQKTALEAFLQQCDLAKFARTDMVGQELKSLHATGVRFVNETETAEVSAPGATVEQEAGTETRPDQDA